MKANCIENRTPCWPSGHRIFLLALCWCTCHLIVSHKLTVCRRSGHTTDWWSRRCCWPSLMSVQWLRRQLYMRRFCQFLPRCMKCRRGLAMRILSVRPSVRLSVRLPHAWSLTKWKKDRCRFYTIRKNIYPSFLRRRMVGGRRPLLREILGQQTPVGTKSPIFNQ